MEIKVSPGKYVVAVSGGVDSMVLLDLLRQQPGLKLLVAHFDHGIRPDSREDRILVERVARTYGLPFVYEKGELGLNASEELARHARYAFLEKVRISMSARAIITAHHEDDVLETAILNMMRGTGRRGVTSLASGKTLARPLLHISKQRLLEYAQEHNLVWREDSTNVDVRYRRNYVRHHIVPALGERGRERMLRLIEKLRIINDDLDRELTEYLESHAKDGKLERKSFILLPHAVAREVMATWLRTAGILGYDRRTLERLVVAAKTYQVGKASDVQKGVKMRIEKDFLALSPADR